MRGLTREQQPRGDALEREPQHEIPRRVHGALGDEARQDPERERSEYQDQDNERARNPTPAPNEPEHDGLNREARDAERWAWADLRTVEEHLIHEQGNRAHGPRRPQRDRCHADARGPHANHCPRMYAHPV